MRCSARVLAGLVFSLAASAASGQAWPNRPVKFFLPAATGSAPDIIARIVSERLVQVWRQQVVIDNRPGAAGNLGVEAAAHAPADGYSLLFTQAAPMSANPNTFKSLPFDPEKDFVPVVRVGVSAMMIAVNPALPAKSLPELIALAKAQPGRISFATSGSKNVPHLAGAAFSHAAGIELLHVPYKSSTQAAADTISGQTQIYIDGPPPIAAHVKNGRLRALAVSSTERLPDFPDIPTIAETLPGFTVAGWFALLAKTGTTAEVIARVNADVNAVLRDPEVAARIQQFGIYDLGGTPEQLGEFIKSDRARWARMVREAGIERE